VKIAYLSSSTIPSVSANSIQVMKMSKSFSDLGHNIITFATLGKVPNILDIHKYYNTEKNFKIIYCKKPKAKIISGIVYGINVAINSFKFDFDIYYGRCPHSLFFSSFSQKPFVYEAHNLPKRYFRAFLENRLFKKKNFLKLVVISEALKRDYLLKFSVLDENKIIVAHDGANIDIEQVKNHLYYSNNKSSRDVFNVGYVGSLFPGKGVEGILSLAKARPFHKYHVVGGTEKEIAKFKKKASSNVSFHGRMQPSNIPSILRKFDILLLLSKKKIETSDGGDIGLYTSPLKMFEYMASGRPIIASKLPVFEEVLKHNVNSFLVSPDNDKLYGEALDLLVENEKLREKFAKNAMNDLISNFTWSKRTKKILSNLDNKS